MQLRTMKNKEIPVQAIGTCELCGKRPIPLYQVKDEGKKLYCRKCTLGFMATKESLNH